ncbi:hypothetical protein CLOM_g21528 [Closterium sp. NIES-68]|nr:hypothetical protein CLOM_g21528 [Closterium sp. NIES-68]GJP66209.1 hypothetical protein CLOP_g23110 [Closterium sp. NIES-67]
MFHRKTQATLVLLPDGSMKLYTGKVKAGDLKGEYPNYYVTSDAEQSTPLDPNTQLQPGGTYYLNESADAQAAVGAPVEKAEAGTATSTPAAAETAPKQVESEFDGVDDDLLSYLTLNDASGFSPAGDQSHRRSLDSRMTKFGATEDLSTSAANSPAFRSFRGSPGSAVATPAAVASSRRRSMGEYPAALSPMTGGAAGAHLSGGGGDVFGGSGPYHRTLGGSGLKNAGSPAGMVMASRAVGGDMVGQQGSTSPATHLERRESMSSGSAGSGSGSGSSLMVW